MNANQAKELAAMHHHHPSRRHRDILTALVVAAAMATLIQQPSAATAAPASSPKVCSLTPAANAMPFGPELVGTIRADGDRIEVLHRVDCDGHTVTWKWLSAADILVP